MNCSADKLFDSRTPRVREPIAKSAWSSSTGRASSTSAAGSSLPSPSRKRDGSCPRPRRRHACGAGPAITATRLADHERAGIPRDLRRLVGTAVVDDDRFADPGRQRAPNDGGNRRCFVERGDHHADLTHAREIR